MRYAYSILICFLTIACGNADDYVQRVGRPNYYIPKTREVVSELEVYVQKFESYHGKKITFPVRFNKLEGKAVGICYSWSDGQRLVEIDKEFFNRSTSDAIEQVVLHEMGHCVLDKGHEDRTTTFVDETKQYPKSIMRSYAFNEEELLVYKKYLDYYIKELLGE